MMNIPLSLVTTANKNAPTNSPVLWDGSDIVVSKEQLINLERLRADLNTLVTKQAEYSSEFKSIKTGIESAKNSVYEIVSSNKLAIKKIEGAVRDTARLEEDTKRHALDMTDISLSHEQNQNRLAKAKESSDLVKSGSLLLINTDDSGTTDTKNQSVSKSRLGEYVFVDANIDDIRLVPGKNVSIKYNLTKGSYGISFEYPKTSDLIKEGHGINIETNNFGRTHIEIKDGLLEARGGLFLQDSTIGVLPSFITTEVGGGITSKKYSEGFELSLDPDLLATASTDYVFSNGTKKVGNQIQLDTSLFPKLVQNLFSKVKYDPTTNTSTISFDGSLVKKPKPILYSADFPIVLDKTVGATGEVLRLNYKLDATWLAKPKQESELLKKTEDYLATIEQKATKSSWEDTSSGLRAVLACPILNLYKVFCNNTDAINGLVEGSASDKKLFETFGSGQTMLTLDVDILPYYSLASNTNSEFNQVQEFDLYLILQHHLQKLQKDSSFVIDEAKKNTKYKILEISGASFGIKKQDDIQPPSYNQEIVLEKVFDSAIESGALSTNFVAPSSWTDDNGRKFRLTSGDVDYIFGTSRNGQINIDRLDFGTDYAIKLVSIEKTKELGHTKYSFVLEDSNTNYVATFLRKVGYDRNPDQDYIIEQSGNTNPGHIRAFCRLYTNWEYSDSDLNTILQFLGQNNSEFCQYFSSYYTDDLEKGTTANKFDSLYFKNALQAIFVVVDKTNVLTTGILKVIANFDTSGYQEIVPSVYSKLKQLNIAITYVVDTRIDLIFDVEKLFEPCC